MATSPTHNGWRYDRANARLDFYFRGTRIGSISASGFSVAGATLAAVAGTFSGLVTAGAGLLVSSGRIREVLTPADVDTQNHTLTAAQIFGGIVIHTSTTGGGTVTTDTAANIVAAGLDADGQCITCYYINDGDQTLTFQGGTSVTPSDTGQTIASNESAILVFRRTTSTTVAMHMVGA